ncbi:RIP metalloprotease RseP [Agitococcus lubricus]|uniref:Zinc metalloprotease n=1 Tax=Agitococcus lubricus TaxID=1077255 RepID=A0A2T5J1T6_9GAMM|nr:RIP metalloprotease RseP [Agitococcus lubricus]PTQ90313.1 regulator of sigma E protease [Agitococcus lubricus]
MGILQIIIAAIIVLGPLIAIHEFGHFWVARRCGVKVLTFSIGFGPALAKWRGKDGVDYQLAAIPLGGFVRMVDEREGEVPVADIPYAFNRQPVLARMAIVAAGPLINLAFAVLLFWVLFLQGEEHLKTIVGSVKPNTPAAVAGLQVGDHIVAVDGKPLSDWEGITYALVKHIGETGHVQLTVESNHATQSQIINVPIRNYLNTPNQDPITALGFTPYQPPLEPIIGEVVADGAAAKQGLQTGDKILVANQQPIKTWQDFVEIVRTHPEKSFSATIERHGQQLTLSLTPRMERDELGHKEGKLGIGLKQQPINIPPAYIQKQDYNLFSAFVRACDKTYDLIVMTVSSLGKMIIGLIGLDNLSGPITIAKVAGHTADIGWQAMIGFMALLSVSLGVLNLLPIPILDGGHLVYYAIEGVLGRPLSESVQQVGLKIGFAIMGCLMFLAIFNDLSRLFG